MDKYVLLLLVFLVGCGQSSSTITPKQVVPYDWNKEFEPFERLAFDANQIVMDESCTFITVKTKEGDFRAELAVEIKNREECWEIWQNQSMKWDSSLKKRSGYSDNRFYLTRLEDPSRPDKIVVDITSGGSSIQALLVGTWITNGYAVPTLPMPSGVDYGESLLSAMSYDDRNIWKDSPKPKFQERDLVVSSKEPTVLWQVISKNFAKNGKDIYERTVGFENGWYYDCLAIIGNPYAGKEGKHFRYIAEEELLKAKD